MKRNILITHHRPDIVSGAENSIADLVARIDPRFSITMLVPGEGKLAQFFRNRGIRVWVRRITGPRRLYPGLHEIESLFLSREIKRQNFDAVLCNTFPAANRIATACRLLKIPYAIYLRDYTPNSPLHKKILLKATTLLAISKDVIKHHTVMVDESHFRLAYNYIDPVTVISARDEHIRSSKRGLPFTKSTPVIGLVGRITPYKQPELFIKAAYLVSAKVPNARFVIIGSAQEREKKYERNVQTLASSLGLDGVVAFLGQRKDAVALTSEFSIACLTSGREPLGRVILEAQLLGIPVIVPDIGGPAEIVEDEITGLQFSSLSDNAAEQLSQQTIRLLQDPLLCSSLIKNGQEHVLSTFANLKHVRIQEDYIDELCESWR